MARIHIAHIAFGRRDHPPPQLQTGRDIREPETYDGSPGRHGFVIDVAVHVPQQELGVEIPVADLADPSGAPGSERFHHRSQFHAGRCQDIANLGPVDHAVDDAGLGQLLQPFRQVRVCRAGGTIGLLSWTPEGFIGKMFGTMKPYAPPPPPGAQPPSLWGNEDHVRALLGDRVTDVEVRRQSVRVTRFEKPEMFRDYFKANYGPTIAVYKAIAEDPERLAALDRELADLARRHDRDDEATVMDWEYVLLTARKRGRTSGRIRSREGIVLLLSGDSAVPDIGCAKSCGVSGVVVGLNL